MSFLSSIKKVLNIGQTEKKRKIALQNIKVHQNTWLVESLYKD